MCFGFLFDISADLLCPVQIRHSAEYSPHIPIMPRYAHNLYPALLNLDPSIISTEHARYG